MSVDLVSVPFGEIPSVSGNGINPFDFPDEEFELYSVPAHESGIPEIVCGADIGSNKQVVSEGMVLLCKINPRINRVWVVKPATGRRQIASTEWIAFDRSGFLSPEYLAHFLRQTEVRDFLAANASGVGGSLMRVKARTLATYTFKLAGRKTQTSIVAKLEELLSGLDAGVAELKAAQKTLRQYRQSLLKAAVDGALTASWRETQRAANKPFETGAELLKRILRERRARWEEKQLTKFKEQGKTPPKDWQKKYLEPVAPDTTGLPALPEGWVWASAEQLCEFITKGTAPPKELDDGSEKTVPFLRVTNLTETGELDLSDKVFVSRKVHEGFLARSVVYPNDVLMNIVGPPLGQVSVVPADFDEWNINQAIAIFRAVSGLLPKFVSVCLLSVVAQAWLKKRAKTTAGQTNLTLEICRALPIPLPSTGEQEEITDKVETQLIALSNQNTAILLSLKQSAAQRQNILRAAFTGQLVRQDPNDEPASVLLERIRSERAAQVATKKPRGRKTERVVA